MFPIFISNKELILLREIEELSLAKLLQSDSVIFCRTTKENNNNPEHQNNFVSSK